MCVYTHIFIFTFLFAVTYMCIIIHLYTCNYVFSFVDAYILVYRRVICTHCMLGWIVAARQRWVLARKEAAPVPKVKGMAAERQSREPQEHRMNMIGIYLPWSTYSHCYIVAVPYFGLPVSVPFCFRLMLHGAWCQVALLKHAGLAKTIISPHLVPMA